MARYTTQADLDLYNANIITEGILPMQINDVIFFLIDKTANGNIYNKSQWLTARLGATIWIEGGSGSYNGIEIGHATLRTVTSDINNKNHIKFFGGRGNVIREVNPLSGRGMQFENYDFLVYDQEYNSFSGMRDGWGSGRSGTFGVKNINNVKDKSAMGLKVENVLGTFKHLEIRGIELSTGNFAHIRASFNNNTLDKVWIERCLITRSVGGEGSYIGSTQAAPWPIHNNFIVNDCIIICTAAEGLQLQQLANGSIVRNNTIICSDIDYRTAFEISQDTGVQLDLVQGDVRFENNIIHGYGTSGIHIFGKDASAQGVAFGTGVPKITNNVTAGGKAGHAIRVHSSFTQAVKLVLRDNDHVSSARNYQDVGDNKNFYIDIDQTIVTVDIIGGKLPVDANDILNSGEANTSVRHFNITREAQVLPQYVNSGFDGIDITQITRWAERYEVGKHHGTSVTSQNPGTLTDGGTATMVTQSGLGFLAGQLVRVKSRGTPTSGFYATVNTYTTTSLALNAINTRTGAAALIDWDIDKRIPYVTTEFVWLAENGLSLPYNLYKCILAHDSLPATRPDLDATKWTLVQWDSAGKNQYDPLYNGTPFTTDFMTVAGDFRLVKGSYHHLLGRGISCSEQRDDQTRYGWQWKQTVSGTIRDIPGAYKYKLKIADYSYLTTGRYYRFWVERLNNSGAFEPKQFTDWAIV